MSLIHMVIQQKLTQLCKALILPPPTKKKICSLWLDSTATSSREPSPHLSPE